MPPEVRQAVEDSLKQTEAMTSNPEFAKMRRQGLEMDRKQQQDNYQSELKKWEAGFPVDPTPLVARRLQTFLDTSATVNFDAKLEKKDGAMKFAESEARRAEQRVEVLLSRRPRSRGGGQDRGAGLAGGLAAQ